LYDAGIVLVGLQPKLVIVQEEIGEILSACQARLKPHAFPLAHDEGLVPVLAEASAARRSLGARAGCSIAPGFCVSKHPAVLQLLKRLV
jgi:hypothetical protein